MRGILDLRIPLDGEPDLPWAHFVLQAAVGGTRVPEWVLLAVPGVVGARLGVAPQAVGGEDVDAALRLLPADPRPALARLLRTVGESVPRPPEDGPRLAPERGRGSFREAVSVPDLLFDAALVVLDGYGPAGFYRCVEALDDPSWDARAAVASMMYLVMLAE